MSGWHLHSTPEFSTQEIGGGMQVRGVITAVQEGRFHLTTDDGRTILCVLSHKAPLEPQDLPALQRRRLPVIVTCEKAGPLIAAVAHDIAQDHRPRSRLGESRA